AVAQDQKGSLLSSNLPLNLQVKGQASPRARLLPRGSLPDAYDYSDVKVLTPDREIQWNELSRLGEDKMKVLMIDVVDQCYLFLTGLCTPRAADIIEKLKDHDEVPEWNDPEPLMRPHL